MPHFTFLPLQRHTEPVITHEERKPTRPMSRVAKYRDTLKICTQIADVNSLCGQEEYNKRLQQLKLMLKCFKSNRVVACIATEDDEEEDEPYHGLEEENINDQNVEDATHRETAPAIDNREQEKETLAKEGMVQEETLSTDDRQQEVKAATKDDCPQEWTPTIGATQQEVKSPTEDDCPQKWTLTIGDMPQEVKAPTKDDCTQKWTPTIGDMPQEVKAPTKDDCPQKWTPTSGDTPQEVKAPTKDDCPQEQTNYTAQGIKTPTDEDRAQGITIISAGATVHNVKFKLPSVVSVKGRPKGCKKGINQKPKAKKDSWKRDAPKHDLPPLGKPIRKDVRKKCVLKPNLSSVRSKKRKAENNDGTPEAKKWNPLYKNEQSLLIEHISSVPVEQLCDVLQYVQHIELPKPRVAGEVSHMVATNAAYETVSEMPEDELEVVAQHIVTRVGNVYPYGETSLILAASIVLKAYQSKVDIMAMSDTVSVKPSHIQSNVHILSEANIRANHKTKMTVGNFSLTTKDLLTMLPGQWLNDKVSQLVTV